MSDGQSAKARMRAAFDRLAPDYDSAGCFAYFGRRLVEEVGVEPGHQVLDVACGAGAVLLPAAERVGPTGTVVGIDLSEGMARIASAKAQQLGLAATVRVVDAERLDFADGAFDRVLCGFGLMFFPHLDQAMAELRRVLRTGGRVGVSTWRVTQVADLAAVLEERHPVGRPEPGWIDEPDELVDLFARSGFSTVQVKLDSHLFRYSDLDAYWRNALGTGIRRRLDALNSDQTARVRAALAERVARHLRPDGLYSEASALLAVGSK